MKRRQGKGAPTDLLVCFPTRAHLTLMPKAICSPSRGAAGPNKNSHNHHPHHLRKSSLRGGGSSGGGGRHGSPYMLSKTKGSDYSEPTSPKVTCAGQIKVRPRPGPCKSWQSVMEEIERLHNNKQKKRPSWAEALGFKKDVMQFLTCLRTLKFDFRCFGSFPNANVTSDDDDDDDEEDEEDDHHQQHNQQELDDQEGSSKAVFSKWFMVLQEDQLPGIAKDKDTRERESSATDDPPCGPPPNALLLMRCRSAPAKSWQEEKEEEEEEEEDDDEEEEEEMEMEKKKLEEETERKQNLEMQEEEKEKKKKRESLEDLMRYESDFYKFSSDIAKETWVVGGIKDILSRSRSSKR